MFGCPNQPFSCILFCVSGTNLIMADLNNRNMLWCIIKDCCTISVWLCLVAQLTPYWEIQISTVSPKLENCYCCKVLHFYKNVFFFCIKLVSCHEGGPTWWNVGVVTLLTSPLGGGDRSTSHRDRLPPSPALPRSLLTDISWIFSVPPLSSVLRAWRQNWWGIMQFGSPVLLPS